MHRPLCVLMLLVMANAVPPAAASAQGLRVGVGAADAIYYPGDRLELAVSASNPGGGAAADFYAGLLLPDGVTVATLAPGGAVRLGALAHPAAFMPLARGINLQGAFTAAVDPLFAYAWTGSEPLGVYTTFIVAVRPGGFDDDRIDGGDVLAVQFGGLALRQPAITTTSGPATSATITVAAGGTLQATAASGARYQLAVPAGAVDHDLVISATPVTSLSGVPLSQTLGAVRFGPDGLRLQVPATLTITLPAAPLHKGVVGFSVQDDGTGFALHPAAVSGPTITIPVTHFSSSGGGFIDCRGVVTTAVGLAACANMQTRLDEAVRIIDGGVDNFSIPLRNLLAAEITSELRPWLSQVVTAAFTDAATLDTSSTVDYFFLTAEREWKTILAIADLAEGLNVTTVLRNELAATATAFEAALAGRQQAANAMCSTDRAHASSAVKRLLDLAQMAQDHGLTINRDTQGITCLTIAVSGSLDTTPVPRSGTTLTASASLRHSDGGLVLDPALRYPVSLTASETAGVTLGGSTSAQGTGGLPAQLSVSATPRQGSGSNLVITLSATVPAAGLALTRDVVAPVAQGFAVSPADVTLRPGDQQPFTLTEDGDPTQLPVSWTATGGQVSAAGLYTAGTGQGHFSVQATATPPNNTVVVRSAGVLIERLSVSPRTATVRSGRTQQFTATRDGQPVSATWSAPTGTFSPTTGSAVTYTAGAGGGAVTVQADDGQGGIGTAQVTVQGVVVSPAQIVLALGQTQQFSVVVEGVTNQAVTWALSGTAAGSTLSSTGLFTAGSTPTTVFVTATSVADPSSVGIAQVTVQGSVVTDPSLNIIGTYLAPDHTQHLCPSFFVQHGVFPVHGTIACDVGGSMDVTVDASSTSVWWDAIADPPHVSASLGGAVKLQTSGVTYRAPRSGVVTLTLNPAWGTDDWSGGVSANNTTAGTSAAALFFKDRGTVITSRPTATIAVRAGDVVLLQANASCNTSGCQGFGRLATITLP